MGVAFVSERESPTDRRSIAMPAWPSLSDGLGGCKGGGLPRRHDRPSATIYRCQTERPRVDDSTPGRVDYREGHRSDWGPFMATTIWGIVRDGKIIPQTPLPEGLQVQITVSEEIFERSITNCAPSSPALGPPSGRCADALPLD